MIKEMLGEIVPNFDIEPIGGCTCACECTTHNGSGTGATTAFDNGSKVPD